MTRIAFRPAALACALAAMAALLLSPVAAAAGSAAFDLPRLDFGPATATVTGTASGAAVACPAPAAACPAGR